MDKVPLSLVDHTLIRVDNGEAATAICVSKLADRACNGEDQSALRDCRKATISIEATGRVVNVP